MKTTYTPMQQTLLSGLVGDELREMEQAIASQLFYAVGIDTLMGGYSLGSTCMPGMVDAPNLYATRAQAEAALKEDQDEYQQQIDDGERDDDDEFEGEVVAVRWDGGDTLAIFDAENDFELESTTAKSVMGM